MYQDRADLIKQKRKQNDWTQTTLAKEVGCGLRTIQRIEDAESSSDKFLLKIAEVLGLDDNQVLVELKKGQKKSAPKMYRLRKLFKGNEVYNFLNNYNMRIIYDYSPHFKGREKMEIVINFFRDCHKYNKALNGMHEEVGFKKRQSENQVNFAFAPILAECNAKKIGIFGKLFCTVTRGRMSLDELENFFFVADDEIHGYYPSHNITTRKEIALLLYAAPFKHGDYIIDQPSFYNPEYIQLPEDYIRGKFTWFMDEIFTDDTVETDFLKPKIDKIIDFSKAHGMHLYFDKKRDEDPEYLSKFYKSDYTMVARDQIFHAEEDYYDYDMSDPDPRNHTRSKKNIDEGQLDEKSIEDGKKDAAEIWNFWEIINKRAPVWSNIYIKHERKNNPDFPDIERNDWYGPDNTIIKEFKIVRVDRKKTEFESREDGVHTQDKVMDHFIGDDGERLEIHYGNEGELYCGEIQIDADTETIIRYEMTKEFKKKVEGFTKQIKNEPLIPYLKLDPEDRAAYRTAFYKTEILDEELPH